MTTEQDPARVARAVIDANSYMTIATADPAGQPWPSPVWYAHAGYREFFWVSSPAARHSRNLADRPRAGIVIFDSHGKEALRFTDFVAPEPFLQGIQAVD